MSTTPTMTPPDPKDALRALLETYLRCPVQPVLNELQQTLVTYQTNWIHARAGSDAAPLKAGPAAGKGAVPKPKFPVGAAEREILERLAGGWTATAADVTRWVWFEDRELIRMEPNPAGEGPDVLRLAPEGWRAIGRHPPEE